MIAVKYIFVVLCLVFLSSCMGDGAFRIKGNIIHADGYNNSIEHNCILEVYRKKNDRLVYSVHIQGMFEESFTISPRENEYYFVIICDGCNKKIKKCCYSLGGSKYVKNPIDLGKIDLICQ